MIAKKDLKHGAYYVGRCRNATTARWNAVEQLFYHLRTKFINYTLIETINHPEDEQRFDTFEPHYEYDPIIPFPEDKS